MAISLRRALLSSRTLACAIRIPSIRSPHTLSSPRGSVVVDGILTPQPTDYYLFDSRRGFSKARKQKFREEETDDEEEEEEDEEVDDEEDDEGVDLGASIKATTVSHMSAAVDALSRELAKMRTGRASSGMLDHIMIEQYGVKTPLNRMAVISVLDPKNLSVSPFDSNAVCKVVVKSSEDVKQSIRRARQKALDRIKKATPKKEGKKDKAGSSAKKDKDKGGPTISEDDVKRLEKEIDDLTKKFKSAEDTCKAKEKEIKGG